MQKEAKIDDEGRWVFLKGDRLFVLDSEDNLQPLEARVITQHQADRFKYLEESFRNERV